MYFICKKKKLRTTFDCLKLIKNVAIKIMLFHCRVPLHVTRAFVPRKRAFHQQGFTHILKIRKTHQSSFIFIDEPAERITNNEF